jgi:isoamylase
VGDALAAHSPGLGTGIDVALQVGQLPIPEREAPAEGGDKVLKTELDPVDGALSERRSVSDEESRDPAPAPGTWWTQPMTVTKSSSPGGPLPGLMAGRPRTATTSECWATREGALLPLGATWIVEEGAFNFSLYSEHAEGVTLLLYGEHDPVHPLRRYRLDPRVNKTTRVWHCRLKLAEMGEARYYAYSVEGPPPGAPRRWHAFDPEKVLLDPYAKDVYFPPGFDRDAARRPGSNAGKAPLGVLVRDFASFEWGDDRAPRHECDLVIYETHVRGFTRSPTSGVAPEIRGTFAGIVAKIPYLKELGVTAVELMPIHQFDPQEGNYWGYMTLDFFAPHRGYAVDGARAADEFRATVKALHAADIAVILDVVYNHTAEGNHRGPTYSYRGIDNVMYYLLSDDPASPYLNFSGTGNTLNCAHPDVQVLILDSLRHWVREMHVDGFRFDLASVFSRGADGSILRDPVPLLTAIRTDPVLRDVHLIAEPWDAGGAYQLGCEFPGLLWHQWNGRFRDEVRRFVRGDPGLVPSLMYRLYGSDDLFPDTLHEARRPFASINYVVAHDGPTLYDLVTYDLRHNEANGHGNTDGPCEMYSWNCGWEGDLCVPDEVMRLRRRQAKNFACLLLLANGVPMFAAGDEFLQTQGGNTNPYNQDNETTWLNWDRLARHADIFRVFRLLIAFRKAHPTISRSRFWRDDVRWYGVGPSTDLGPDSHSLAYCLHGASVDDCDLYVMINGHVEPLLFEIQEGRPGNWRRVVDTGREAPHDVSEPGEEPALESSTYRVEARSVVVLLREPGTLPHTRPTADST